MSDEKLNPHTGQPIPEDPKPQASEGGEKAGASTPAAPASSPATTGPATPEASAETAAPSQMELAVRSALESVMDPEINLSVIDLGLIREVHILPEKTHIRMMLTTPFCPYAPQMVEDVKNATLTVRAKEVDVELMPDAWNPEMMPDPTLLGYSF